MNCNIIVMTIKYFTFVNDVSPNICGDNEIIFSVINNIIDKIYNTSYLLEIFPDIINSRLLDNYYDIPKWSTKKIFSYGVPMSLNDASTYDHMVNSGLVIKKKWKYLILYGIEQQLMIPIKYTHSKILFKEKHYMYIMAKITSNFKLGKINRNFIDSVMSWMSEKPLDKSVVIAIFKYIINCSNGDNGLLMTLQYFSHHFTSANVLDITTILVNNTSLIKISSAYQN